MNHAIETQDLIKTFGTGKTFTKALDGVNLLIPRGSVYGILGPNGAGKTTTIRILTTLLKPSSGRALVMGHDVEKEAATVRQKVSLTGQYASVDEELTGYENLILISRLLGLSWGESRLRATELLKSFDLAEAAKKQVRTFSGGMRRRIDIAASLITRPQILFLDEPTTGLDPRSRNQVWDLVRQIASSGTTVLLTTQYLEEADRLAGRLAVIDHGKVIAEGTSRDLKSSVGGNTLHFQLVQEGATPQARTFIASKFKDALLPGEAAGMISLKVRDAASATEVLTALANQNLQVSEFTLGTPSLDDVFFALTGRPAEDKPNNLSEGQSL